MIEHADAETVAVYDAEQAAAILAGLTEHDLHIAPSDVPAFLADTLAVAGCDRPLSYTILWDVAPDEPRIGFVDEHNGRTRIHLDPTAVDRAVAVHELAHALRRDGHGQAFRARLVNLWALVFGDAAAHWLQYAFTVRGLDSEQAA